MLKDEGGHQPNAQPVVFHSPSELEANPETAGLTAACWNIILKNVKLFFPLSKNRAMCKLNHNLGTNPLPHTSSLPFVLEQCWTKKRERERERSQKPIHNKSMLFLIPEK